MLTSMPNVVAAVTMCTPAHNSVSPWNSRTMRGRLATSGASWQKSDATRAITGRPITTEPANSAASTTVVATGCTK